MTTFVLVHGAWHGSWCWQRVRKALQQQGHEVFAPTLTGVGERSHLLSKDVDLRTQTLDVLNLIQWEELNDFVLCGHSYGGMVVSGVVDRIPERIRSLMFLDAFVPEHGQCLADFAPVANGPIADGYKCAPITAAMFGVNAADQAWVDRQCTPHSLACFQQPVDLSKGGLKRIKRISYVYATGWASGQSSFLPFYQKAQSRGWETAEVSCGHDVMLDLPEQTTQMLLDINQPPPACASGRR